MGNKLSFGTGLREFDVNGSYVLRFNPTDTEFVRRFQDAVERMRGLQDALEADLPALTDAVDAALTTDDVDAVAQANRAMMARLAETSGKIRAEIDELFGEGAAEGVFPDGMSLCTSAEGMPVWVNFLEAVADVIADAFEAERGKADPRARATSAKYKKTLAKYRKQRRG